MSDFTEAMEELLDAQEEARGERLTVVIGNTATSGTLTVGVTYKIITFVTGDVFTNVGAASNATDVVFTATGTTPTTWTHASTLGPAYDAIIERIDADLVPTPGMLSELGGFKCIVRQSDFPSGAPAKFTAVTLDGLALTVLDTASVNETYEITVGDVTAEQSA